MIKILFVIVSTLIVNVTVVAQTTPVGVASGGAGVTVTSTPSQTTITQTNSREIINWDSGFNVPSGHRLLFQQPNASAIILNRDKSGTPSSILGNIAANGQVWIINQSGILFGPNSQINVAGLLASTADISNNRFLADDFRFSGATQGVINQGDIQAQYYAVLTGRSVSNTGLIQSNLGKIVLGAGNAYTLNIANNNLISFEITDPSLLAQIQNTGTISAQGGMIYISASQVQNAIGGVVNVGGLVNADTVQNVAGAIQIVASDTTVSGTVSASTIAQSGDTMPGMIAVMGDTIRLTSSGKLISQADLSDGTVYVGGDPTVNPVATSISYDVGSEVITTARGIQVPAPPPTPPPVVIPSPTISPINQTQLYALVSEIQFSYNKPIIIEPTYTLPSPSTSTSTIEIPNLKPSETASVSSNSNNETDNTNTNTTVQVDKTNDVTTVSLPALNQNTNVQVGAQTFVATKTPASPEDATDPVLAAAKQLNPIVNGIKIRQKSSIVSIVPGVLRLDTIPVKLSTSLDDYSLSGSGNRSRW